VSKRIVISQSFIDKKGNEATSFDADKVADMITEELIPKKSRKIYEQQYEGFVSGAGRNEWKTTA
jgi:coenzyme F420-reducing hydrogenase alpha subunit